MRPSPRAAVTAVIAVLAVALTLVVSGCAAQTARDSLADSSARSATVPDTTQPDAESAPDPDLDSAPQPAPEPAAPPAPAIGVQAATVAKVVDGDTVHVRLANGTLEKVRFIGVDTPEVSFEREPYGEEASDYTRRELLGKKVYLQTDVDPRDRYDRLLAYVWLDKPTSASTSEIRARMFNARLLLDGYASVMTVPPNVKYADQFLKFQREARDRNRGLWGMPLADSPAPAPQPSGTGSGTPYIGNRNTGKFHEAGCSSVDDMNPANKVPLQSREAAIEAGYVPCKRCNP